MNSKHKSKNKKDYNLSDVYEQDYKDKDKGSGGNRPNYLDLSEYPDLEFYKVKKGKNKISILQYRITTDNHPKGREQGKTDYKLPIFVHRFFGESEGNYLCMKETFNKSCPACKEIKKMIDSKEYTYKDKEVKDLRAQQREIFIIQDLMEDDDKIYLLDISHWEFLKELLSEAERDEKGFVPFADLEDGRAIIFYGEEREGEFKNTSLKPTGFRFKEREPIDEKMLDEVPSLDALLFIPSYEEMEKDLYGISSSSLEENDDDDDQPKKKSRKIEDDDDDDDQPKKKSRKIEDDDDNEEDSEDDIDEDSEDDIDEDMQNAMDNDDDQPKKVRKSDKKESSSKKKCPHGHKFGDDCDDHKECKKCKLWDDCSEAYGK